MGGEPSCLPARSRPLTEASLAMPPKGGDGFAGVAVLLTH
jgi:hypothetical protein